MIFKSDYTEQINKIVLSSNDDKMFETFDKITAYLYGTNAFKVCKSEMLLVMLKKDLRKAIKDHF